MCIEKILRRKDINELIQIFLEGVDFHSRRESRRVGILRPVRIPSRVVVETIIARRQRRWLETNPLCYCLNKPQTDWRLIFQHPYNCHSLSFRYWYLSSRSYYLPQLIFFLPSLQCTRYLHVPWLNLTLLQFLCIEAYTFLPSILVEESTLKWLKTKLRKGQRFRENH
jgi:hypothetical protein